VDDAGPRAPGPLNGRLCVRPVQVREGQVNSDHQAPGGLEKAKHGLRYAINFLHANAGIEDESLLSSPLFFIAIAYFSQMQNERVSKDEEQQLLYWLHVANARGRYSRGSTETLLDADLSALTRGGGPKTLIETVRQQFGRLTIEPSDLAGVGSEPALLARLSGLEGGRSEGLV